jgi:hypothetical protein
VDAAASGAWTWLQGGRRLVSDQGAQTDGAAAYGKSVWFRHPLLVSSRRRFLRILPGSQNLQSAGDGGKTEFVAEEITP